MIVLAHALGWLMVAGVHLIVFLVHYPWAGVPVAFVAWVAFVYFKPYKTCRWCRTPEQRRRRRGRRCWRCNGHKLVRRLGAKHVHKVKLSLIQAWDERGTN